MNIDPAFTPLEAINKETIKVINGQYILIERKELDSLIKTIQKALRTGTDVEVQLLLSDVQGKMQMQLNSELTYVEMNTNV